MRLTETGGMHVTISHARAEDARATTAPGQLVAQARRLAEKAQELVDQAVIAERQRDTSWEQIGSALGGLTKSAAHKRYGKLVSEWDEYAEVAPIEDEDDGPQGHCSLFSIAYALVEQTWAEADALIHAQDLLAKLNNATAVVSGRSDVTRTEIRYPDPQAGELRLREAVDAAVKAIKSAAAGPVIPAQSSGSERQVAGTPGGRALIAREQEARRAREGFVQVSDCPRCAEPSTWRVLSPHERTSVEKRLSAVEEQLAELLAERDRV